MSTQQLQEIESYVLETAKGYGVSSEDPKPESLLKAHHEGQDA